jgi:hypothetical protein
LREAQRFFSHLFFPGVVELAPVLVPSAGEEAQALLGALVRREIVPELVGDPETLLT